MLIEFSDSHNVPKVDKAQLWNACAPYCSQRVCQEVHYLAIHRRHSVMYRQTGNEHLTKQLVGTENVLTSLMFKFEFPTTDKSLSASFNLKAQHNKGFKQTELYLLPHQLQLSIV